MRVLHILQNSLPKVSGSTIRTRYIFKYQRKFAQLVALTTFHYTDYDNEFEVIEGVPYYRINKKKAKIIMSFVVRMIKLKFFLFKHFNVFLKLKLEEILPTIYISNYISKLVRIYNIDIIHGHSIYQAARYGLKVARKRKIPFIYDVRGFGEQNLMANTFRYTKDKKWLTFRYFLIKERETSLMKKSDLLLTLSKSMKDEIIGRGINADKVEIIPNGTDADALQPIEPNSNLKAQLGIENSFVIGYVGRLSMYEGLDILLKAVPILAERVKNVKVLLVGNFSKYYLNFLKDIINKLDISDYVLFTGPLPHKEIKNYYSVIDIIVLPRLNYKVGRIVTPLKPIEAMAFKTLVIASDFPAFRSTITPKKTGDLFEPENPDDLAFKIIYYINNPDIKIQIENSARELIEREYDWKKLVPKYKNIYFKLLNKSNL